MMRKIISFILCLAISVTLFAIPVHAESNIYSAYLDVLNEAVAKYGEYTAGEYQTSTGVGYVNLVDFDGDGINELIYCVGETHDYTYHIYGYKDGGAVLLDEGSMEAHGGDSNWEISILYNSAKSRLITYRYDGPYANSTYMTVGEYNDGVWTNLKDVFVSEYCEIEPGGSYYMNYYVNNEQVDESEFNNRFNSLSRHGGRIDIRWTEFSGKYLEEIGQSLSDMNYWFGDKTDTFNDVTPWETGEYEAEMIIGDYIFYDGPFMDENGIDQHDGIYALNVYNSATRTDKTLLYRGYGLRRIGDKLFAFSGISSGSWDRNLYCFDLNGENIQKITNGVDMQFAMSDEPFTIFNDRIYVGHCSDMEHFEIISFATDGMDIRVEVPSVYSTEWDCKLYDGYAIIDGVRYNYQSSSDNIKVVLNKKELSFDNPPRIISGRTLVPMRAIFEAMEAIVSWDGTSQTVTAVYNGITIKLTIGEGNLYVNGTAKELDVSAQLINNTTYVPVRVIAEAFDADVSWDEVSQTVSIKSNFQIINGIYLDGKHLDIDAEIFSTGTTADIKILAQILGLTYKENKDGSYSIEKDDKVMTFDLLDKKYVCTFKNNPYGKFSMDWDIAAYRKGDTVMASLSKVCSCFGYKTQYYGYDGIWDIYITTPPKKIPQYTDNDEYNEFIYSKLKSDSVYVFLEDYDNDGDEEAFAFYKPKRSSKLNCDFFDFGEKPYSLKNIFKDKETGKISFGIVTEGDKKAVEMISDGSYINYHYGFSVKDNNAYYKPVYAVSNTPNFNKYNDIYSYNGKAITDKYEYSNGESKSVDVPMYIPCAEGEYWGIHRMEVKPEFLLTFENGEDIYKRYVEEKVSKGDKVQVLYAPNNTIHLNFKHYNEKKSIIESTYQDFIFKSDSPNKLESLVSGEGNIPKGTWWWWSPPIVPGEDDQAYQYVCDTSDYYDDNSSWLSGYDTNKNITLKIFFNGSLLELTEAVQERNGRTMYPLRQCLELMGADVYWNGDKGEAIAELDDIRLTFKIGSDKYYVNGIEKEMDVETYIDDFRNITYIPIRYAAEAFGYTVNWLPGRGFNTIVIGDLASYAITTAKDLTTTLNNKSNAAKMGKELYKLLENQGFMEEIKRLNEVNLNSMQSIIECDLANSNNDLTLDITNTLVNGLVAVARTMSGDIDAGLDYINGKVIGMTSEVLTNIASPKSQDEIVRAICNSAYDDNIRLITELSRYHYSIGSKMTDTQYREYLIMYKEIMMNNRSLKMGIEYFTKDISGNIISNLSKVAGTLAWNKAKETIISKSGIIPEAYTLTDAFIYQTTEDYIDSLFQEFIDSQNSSLKSWATDMKAMGKQFDAYLK